MAGHHKKHFDAEKIFKKKFISEFEAFKHDSDVLARGAISFSGEWKDWLGVASLSSVFVTGGAVLSGMVIAGIVTGFASLGIGLGISLVAIGAEVAYTLYRSKKKGREYHRASYFLSNENFQDDVENIAEHLAKLYFMQISECKRKEDAEGLAIAHFQSIKYELMKNKAFQYRDLLHTGSLQGILLKNAPHVSKKSIHMNAVKNEDCNWRSIIKRPALYCAENHKFYTTMHSRPEKYGVLVFVTKQELDDFRIMSEKIVHDKRPCNETIWKYSKVRSAEADILRHNRFFKHHIHHNDTEVHEEDTLEM